MTLIFSIITDNPADFARLLTELAAKASLVAPHEIDHPEVDIEQSEFPRFWCSECKEYFEEAVKRDYRPETRFEPAEWRGVCPECGSEDIEETDG